MPTLPATLLLLTALVGSVLPGRGWAQEPEAIDGEAEAAEPTNAQPTAVSRAWATITLDDGTVFEGPLLGMSDRGFVLEVDGIAITLARSVVAAADIEQRVISTRDGAGVGATAELAWMILRRVDGTITSGTLVRQTAGEIVLLSGSAEVAVPRAEIASTAVGVLGGEDTALPTLHGGAAAPPPAISATDARLRSPEWQEYTQRRMLMLDHKARLIGPPTLGYGRDAFHRRANGRYHIVFGKRVRTRLRTVEFGELVQDPTFTAALELALQRTEADRKAGWAFIGGGAGAILAAVVLNSLGAANSDLSPVLFGGVPLLASGVTFFVVGASLDVKSRKRRRTVRGFDLSELLPRDRAWVSMQRYNSSLRRELGLEDDEELDSLDEVVETASGEPYAD